MTATLITPPAIEPVSLAEAKAHLRVDGDDEDALIAATVSAARLHVEQATRRALIAQGWRIWMDAWPVSRVVELPLAPLISVDAVSVFDAAGDAEELDPATYEVDTVSVPGRIRLKGSPPAPEREMNGIAIDVTAGYGEEAGAVPAPLRQAIFQLAAHWYENRSAVTYDRAQGIAPLGVDALIAPYRVVAL
jgi:uncharacterized phiE125 gp8 family phage protein